MTDNLPLEEWKRRLRRESRRRLEALAGNACLPASVAIGNRVLALPEWKAAALCAGFVPMPGEPDLQRPYVEILRGGKRLALPRYRAASQDYEMVVVPEYPGSLTAGAFGIPEPHPDLPPLTEEERTSSRTLWLVPGLAFDRQGRRLGRGGGFYDRLLRGVAGFKIGVAFACQMVEEVPSALHDAGVDAIATEHEMVRCRCQATARNKE